jgi:hypothetical protein
MPYLHAKDDLGWAPRVAALGDCQKRHPFIWLAIVESHPEEQPTPKANWVSSETRI